MEGTVGKAFPNCHSDVTTCESKYKHRKPHHSRHLQELVANRQYLGSSRARIFNIQSVFATLATPFCLEFEVSPKGRVLSQDLLSVEYSSLTISGNKKLKVMQFQLLANKLRHWNDFQNLHFWRSRLEHSNSNPCSSLQAIPQVHEKYFQATIRPPGAVLNL